jgi:hypothetical protein
MEERDWYLKEVQKLARLLARLTGFREQGHAEAAKQLINESYLDLLGSDAASWSELTDDRWFNRLRLQGLKPDQLNTLAEILIEESNWLILEGQPDQGRQCIRQAIVVFDYLTEMEHTFSMKREARIRQLREKLS